MVPQGLSELGTGLSISRNEKPYDYGSAGRDWQGIRLHPNQWPKRMHSFDFITSPKIRESLESDYREMSTSAQHGNAKSTLVMAGSIMEALLVDYLINYPNTQRIKKTDPLKMTLADAIEVCLNEGILTARTAELCTVVRTFRNLIHPGLMVRINEPVPDQDSAIIAVSLVNRIVTELAVEMRKRIGLTAEQVVAKIEGDPQAARFLTHHLSDLQEPQRMRLLLDVIPEHLRHFLNLHDREPDADHDQIADDLRTTYRAALDGATLETKVAVAAEFVRVARQGDGTSVNRYVCHLFRAPDLAHVPSKDRPIAVALILDAVGPSHVSARTLDLTEGICPFLGPGDVPAWLDPLIKGMFAGKTVDPGVYQRIRQQIAGCGFNTTTDFDGAVDSRLILWDKTLAEFEESPDGVAKVRSALAALKQSIIRI